MLWPSTITYGLISNKYCTPLCRKVPAKLIVFPPIFPKMAGLAGCGWLLKLAGAKPAKLKQAGILLHNAVWIRFWLCPFLLPFLYFKNAKWCGQGLLIWCFSMIKVFISQKQTMTDEWLRFGHCSFLLMILVCLATSNETDADWWIVYCRPLLRYIPSTPFLLNEIPDLQFKPLHSTPPGLAPTLPLSPSLSHPRLLNVFPRHHYSVGLWPVWYGSKGKR